MLVQLVTVKGHCTFVCVCICEVKPKECEKLIIDATDDANIYAICRAVIELACR